MRYLRKTGKQTCERSEVKLIWNRPEWPVLPARMEQMEQIAQTLQTSLARLHSNQFVALVVHHCIKLARKVLVAESFSLLITTTNTQGSTIWKPYLLRVKERQRQEHHELRPSRAGFLTIQLFGLLWCFRTMELIDFYAAVAGWV